MNLLLYLQMQQYLQWVDTVSHNPGQGKGRDYGKQDWKQEHRATLPFARNHMNAPRERNSFKVIPEDALKTASYSHCLS